MNTLEMINTATETGKTYFINDMRYSTEYGFHNRNRQPWNASSFKYVNDIMELPGWKVLELEPRKMTLKEVEDELGYRVELVSA